METLRHENIEERAEDANKSKIKIGHRRIDKAGEVSYKRVPTNALMGAIQLGIANTVGSLASRPKRDILVQDFQTIETVNFPGSGTQITPTHSFGDFRFLTYAPIAFRYFRELFKIKPADFLASLCTFPLKELSNPGASGSIFYVSADDKFIIKTVQHKEAEFLRTLLSGYYMNLHQNPLTLLPKFFGLYCYQRLGKNIRLIVMNNLLPQSIAMHHKFDLKGSTYKRFASKLERSKDNPTLKDLNFNKNFPQGVILNHDIYEIIMDVIKRDCLVLESFKIMDYSLLIGIHNIDVAASQGAQESQIQQSSRVQLQHYPDDERESQETTEMMVETWKSLQRDFGVAPPTHDQGGVPAKTAKGERLLIYLGIIDILQSYQLFKKFEHACKAIFHDGDQISVTNPTFYADRFKVYIGTKVFQSDQPHKSHINKFRTLVHSYMAMKQTPARPIRTQSIGEGHDVMSQEPESSFIRGTAERVSQTPRQPLQNEQEKRRTRLFITNIDELNSNDVGLKDFPRQTQV